MGNQKKQRIFLACIVIAILMGLLILSVSRREHQPQKESTEETSERAAEADTESFSKEETETTENTPSEAETSDAAPSESEAADGTSPEAEPADGTPSENGSSDDDAENTNSLPETERPEYANDLPDLSWLNGIDFPAYSGEAYTAMNGNRPYFDTEELVPESFELYYPLDALGRCTMAEAVIGQDTMASGSRGEIWMVKPAGWHSDRYASVDGEALYNRCHLIAHYLSDEDANPRNLVTGTRYMNTYGMNAAENMIGDYVKETGNHVRYRVTPVYTGDHLLCDGLLVEAYSIEDDGEDICFCIYAYNVQPGFVIDYATGDNYSESGEEKLGAASETTASYEDYLAEEDENGTYILNVKSKKFHRPDCQGAKDISEKNRKEYTGSRNRLVEDGYKPCGSCNP